MPNHIQVLSAHVANKIAAGEVVERPASVLKELMENSLDAGATQIDVEISAGGRKLISVRDNGSGMNRDDALLSIERQATSKIRDVDDIEKISTLGFRGEALGAISSASRFKLSTCSAESDAGTEVSVSGGKIHDVADCGCPVGTEITVRDLFFNIPARRKFMRTQKTEMSHIRGCFIVMALARPDAGMSLNLDGHETYRLAAKSTLEDRLRDLFGSDFQYNLRPLNKQLGDVSVSGYVSIPSANRADRSEQYVFVNGRAASAPVLNYAINEGYHTLLPKRRFASVFIFLEMDPSLVDVNVHPTKKEVRFRSSGDVRDALIFAIRSALEVSASPSEIRNSDEPASFQPAADVQLKIHDLPTAKAFQYPRITPVENGDAPKVSETFSENINDQSETEPPWSWCRVIGQAGDLYVVLETGDGIVMMDPHAAHERVLFDKYMNALTSGKIQSQSLLIPETVKLRHKDSERITRNLDLFKKMGFGISEFGGDTFIIDAMPSCLADASATSLLNDIALSFDQSGSRGGTEKWSEQRIAQAACKAAVKARDRLSLEEIERLVIDLGSTTMPYTCPHGRPTLVFTSYQEINRQFGRG